MWVVDRADLDRLLVILAELDGSDLHIKAGAPPRMRIAGALRTLDDEPSFANRVRIVNLKNVLHNQNKRLFNDSTFTSILQLLAKSLKPPHTSMDSYSRTPYSS